MATTQEDTMGMLQLHCPHDPVVDICFVHGIRGGNISTWCLKDKKVCWPRNLLPHDIADARILSFGYDASVLQFWSKVSQNTMAQHASNLSARLAGNRSKSDEQRPIIFVTHSLGGLVYAQALIYAYKSAEKSDRAMEESVRRIAFLGTPFQGSDIAKWTDFGRKITDLFGDTNKVLLDDLKQGSYQLKAFSEKFPEWLRGREGAEATKVEIVCFTEEFVTGHLGKIVTDESAHIKGYKVLTLHANHQDMCKFSDKDDENYKAVMKVLLRWVKDLKEQQLKKPKEVRLARNNSTMAK
ncbi:MAG: hypothetical protein Q9192_006055 [Flavoplaca navasiana]